MIKKLLFSCFAIFGLTFFLSLDSHATTISCSPNMDSSSMLFSTACSDISTLDSSRDWFYIIKFTLTQHSGSNIVFHNNTLSDYNQNFSAQINTFATTPPYYALNTKTSLVFSDSYSSTSYHFNRLYSSSSWFSAFLSSLELEIADSIDFSSDSIPRPTDSLFITENGTFDVTNYATAVVDVPQVVSSTSWVVDIFKDGFWGIMTALVALIVPVLVLFLIFRLVHDWLWGKG